MVHTVEDQEKPAPKMIMEKKLTLRVVSQEDQWDGNLMVFKTWLLLYKTPSILQSIEKQGYLKVWMIMEKKLDLKVDFKEVPWNWALTASFDWANSV